MEATNRLQRSRLALVTLGHFLNDSYSSFFTPILPVLIEKLSLSLTADQLSGLPDRRRLPECGWRPQRLSGSRRLTGPEGAAPHASGRQSASAV